MAFHAAADSAHDDQGTRADDRADEPIGAIEQECTECDAGQDSQRPRHVRREPVSQGPEQTRPFVASAFNVSRHNQEPLGAASDLAIGSQHASTGLVKRWGRAQPIDHLPLRGSSKSGSARELIAVERPEVG